MVMDARKAALEILLDCQRKNTTLDRTLDAFSPGLSHLSQADKNLCHAIVFGVLRHQNYLDFIIRSFARTPMDRMDLTVRFALRMALFQMRFLDRIPDFAAIDTSVEMIKAQNGKKTAGFVNGVLRNAARQMNTLVMPDENKELLDHLSIVHSIPLWLARRWLTRFGANQALELCRTVNQIPPLILRTNTLKISRPALADLLTSAGCHAQFTPLSPDGLFVTESPPRIEAITGFEQGLFAVQDEAAQLISLITDPRPDETILDACAGLGGKTLHLAQLMKDQGHITALDIDPGQVIPSVGRSPATGHSQYPVPGHGPDESGCHRFYRIF
jgi:16S rRNA (cytosine967-C5)-methyltransferase